MADDLFTRADEADAAQALAAARLDRDAAARRVIGAPRCRLGECRSDLVAATAKVIEAEQALAQVQAHRRVWY
ncbi:hypothetical protein [Caulobacter henricii]|uniref:Uncharacterized protein n=1 Tax=Caulobacter henricii TaxID=69395 RepID=A0A0P0P201_9CAUL|nr:hypothetical protein [Caulobacter henricii]ALL14281.1 hypothetical protein AQ619_13525 [Caulobacter henricii]